MDRRGLFWCADQNDYGADMSKRTLPNPRLLRCGSALTELIVAGGLLATAISLVGTCVVGGHRIERMQREHTLAVDELSNQLERLTALPVGELELALQQLQPSTWVTGRLPEAQLTAERLTDEWGDRIKMQFQWKRKGNPPPLIAVAWLTSDEEQRP